MNLRPSGYEPDELPTAPPRDINGAEDRNRTGTRGKSRRILSPVRLPVPPLRHIIFLVEATPRFELGIKELQSTALPLGYVALNWGG